MKTGTVLAHVVRLLRIGWNADPNTIRLYYLTAILAGLLPLGVSVLEQQLLNGFVRVDPARPGEGAILLLSLYLGGRYLFSGVENFLRWVYGGMYLDFLQRYRMQNAVSLLFAEKLSGLDMGHLENPEVQNLIAKARGTYMWRTVDILRTLAYLVIGVVGWIGSLLLLVSFEWWIPILLLVATVPRFLLQLRQGELLWSMWGSGAPQVKKLYYVHGILTSLSSIPEIRVFRSGRVLLERFRTVQDELLAINKVALDRYILVQWIPLVVEGGVICTLGLSRLDEALARELPVGTFMLFLALCERFTSSSAQVVTQIASIRSDALFASHFFEVLDLPPLITEPTAPVSLSCEGSPRIEFRNVSFAYPNGREVLHDISFVVEAGETVALVGKNGAGKSTIIKLLLRFYEVTGGEILVAGRNLNEIERSDWYRYLGTLFQSFVEFHFTVRENILLGCPERIDEEGIRRAARLAQADQFIEQLPLGFDQPLGTQFEDGAELSRGQWQKLAIARAFYQQAPILILDEPTSAVDAEAEYEIFNNLREHYRGKTLLFVSHRFSSVRNAERIIVIEEGCVKESGNHESLLALHGRYAAMFRAQASGYV